MNAVTIKHKIYTHIKTRALAPVLVYKHKEVFLRVGPKKILNPEIKFHKNLIKLNFPVAKIIDIGKLNNKLYFTEQSLGNKLLFEFFSNDFQQQNKISDKNFKILLNICLKFAKAQIKTASNKSKKSILFKGVHMDSILKELPKQKQIITKAFNKAVLNIQHLPYVLTHGDLNPHNIFKKGIIDFGSNFVAPLGYDLVCVIYNTSFFPKNSDYEFSRLYNFTNEQKQTFFKKTDGLYTKHGFPPLSKFINDYIFLRSVWATAHMQKYPKIQKWRYDLFKKIILNYLNDRSLTKLLK